jgi:hypothetical protein
MDGTQEPQSTGSADDAEMAATPPSADTDQTGPDWGAIGRGALAGLAVMIAVSLLNAVLDHEVTDFDDSGWQYPLFVLVLVGYGLAGWVGQWSAVQRGNRDTPLMVGALAGIGVLVGWLPIRIVIWLVRDESRGLFTGDDAALRPGQMFGHVVIAAGLGMLGAYFASRVARRITRSTVG